MERRDVHQRPQSFQGFEPLTANYVYCPNQFFDVCLSHGSRGVVRLVAYLLRRTLGWLDANGEPVEQEIAVSFRELIEEAGISRGAIRQAVDDAVAMSFIECVREGRAKQRGEPAQTAQYRLKWDTAIVYTKSVDEFDGFFAGEGHRSPVPNAFFDHVVPHEPLAVVKVVGTVLRHTVGYQNQFGGRRLSTPLSYRQIHDYARLSDGKTLAQALQRAQHAGYIECVTEGCFSPDPMQQQAASYGVRWLHQATATDIGSKNPADAERSKTPSRIGSEVPAAGRFKKPSTRKTVLKNTDKQQVVAVDSQGFEMLREAGFDEAIARELAAKRGIIEIKQQIAWLDARSPQRNRLGMLRKAIQENWPSPVDEVLKQVPRRQQRERTTVQSDPAGKLTAERQARRERLLRHWQQLDEGERSRLHRQAIDAATSAIVKRRLHSHVDSEHPPSETLMMLKHQHP